MKTGSSPWTRRNAAGPPSRARGRNRRKAGVVRAPVLAVLFLVLAGALLLPSRGFAQHDHDHGAASHEHDADPGEPVSAPVNLQESGNGAFAAIQEVVAELNARGGETDWSRVDLEALRQHLIDMERFIVEAEIVEREDVEGGIRVAVRGSDPETDRSLRRSLHAHAPMLEQETGWSVSVSDRDDAVVLRATAETSDEVERIRGLGYVGLMVTGSHHREHHWLIATGRQPHAQQP